MDQGNVLQNLAVNARQGKLQSIQTPMLTTLGTLAYASVAIPDWAIGFRMYPSAAIRWAISEAPVAISTATFVIGAIADATTWLAKTLDTATSRTFQATAVSTATTVILEIY